MESGEESKSFSNFPQIFREESSDSLPTSSAPSEGESTNFGLFTSAATLLSDLRQNVFFAEEDSALQAKAFHETIEYLEGKESLLGLDPFEREELVRLQLRKKKDLKEILSGTYEKFKDELTVERRKEFLSELQSLDHSIQVLSQESQKK